MQNPGRGPMMKTGRNIPKEFMGPDAAKMYEKGGPQIGQGPGDGIKKKLETLTGTTYKGLFSGRQMVANSSKNTDLLEVGKEAVKKAYKKVKSFFD